MGKRSKNENFKTNMKNKRNNPGKSNASTNPWRKAPGKDDQKGTFFRTKNKIKLLNLYKEKPNLEKMKLEPNEPVRIEPDRKWFGNIRTINQTNLEKLRIELKEQTKDPYQMLIKKQKLPISLIRENNSKLQGGKLVDIESFKDTFGPKSKRIRPKINFSNMDELANNVIDKQKNYKIENDKNLYEKQLERLEQRRDNREKFLEAGQSKRIWEELYKVVDSSDVLIFVLDARNPLGTLCRHIEEHVKKNCPLKHIIYVINKIDLIPKNYTTAWLKYFSEKGPTITFSALLRNPFGNISLINLIKQIDKFHKQKKSISIGFIGYPNVGKSSIINAIKKKNVCKSAPIPGETKIWQYVALTKRIYLIDCPGIVYASENDSHIDIVLKGVVRAEKISDPDFYINEILKKAGKICCEVYGIEEYKDYDDFLRKLAIKQGKLLKGGEPDILNIGKNILHDWQRGNIPYYEKPPNLNK